MRPETSKLISDWVVRPKWTVRSCPSEHVRPEASFLWGKSQSSVSRRIVVGTVVGKFLKENTVVGKGKGGNIGIGLLIKSLPTTVVSPREFTDDCTDD